MLFSECQRVWEDKVGIERASHLDLALWLQVAVNKPGERVPKSKSFPSILLGPSHVRGAGGREQEEGQKEASCCGHSPRTSFRLCSNLS